MGVGPSVKNRAVELTLAPEPLSSINISQCLAVADRCFPHPSDQEFLRSHWERVLSGQTRYYCHHDQEHLTLLEHFAYKTNSLIVGFGGLYRHDDQPHRLWLNWFGIDPDTRGLGLGSNLLEHLSEIASSHSAKTLVGYTGDTVENAGTQRFYERAGFRRATTYDFKGETVRLYEKALSGRP
jgi:ribosomal protein S18 acetylase RimI-like enzyme